MLPKGKPVFAYVRLDDLREHAEEVIADLRIGMPDDGAIVTDILSREEMLSYKLASYVLQYCKENR